MPRSLRWLGTRARCANSAPALVPGPTPARRQTGRGRAVRRFATARQAPCSVTASPGLRSGAVSHKMAFVGPAAGKPRLFGGSSTDRPGPWPRVMGLHRSHSDTLEEDLRQADVTMCFSAVSLRCACNEQAAWRQHGGPGSATDGHSSHRAWACGTTAVRASPFTEGTAVGGSPHGSTPRTWALPGPRVPTVRGVLPGSAGGDPGALGRAPAAAEQSSS